MKILLIASLSLFLSQVAFSQGKPQAPTARQLAMSIARQCYGYGFNGDGSHESKLKAADMLSEGAIAFAMANDPDLPEKLVLNYAVTILNQRLRPRFIADEDGAPMRIETEYTEDDYKEFQRQKRILLERLVALPPRPARR